MNIKSIVCLFATVFISIFVSISAFAATTIYVGDIEEDGDYAVVYVCLKSTEYTDIYGYNIQVMYDPNKIDEESFNSDEDVEGAMTYLNSRGKETATGTAAASDPITDDNSNYHYIKVVGASTSGVPGDVYDDGSKLFCLYLKPTSGYSVSDITSADFGLKFKTLASDAAGLGYAQNFDDGFASYVAYNVPIDVENTDPEWEHGYIKEMYVTITDAATGEVLKEKVQLTNYIENGDYYCFIVNLTEETKGYTSQLKSIVDVKFSALVTDEDGLYFTEKALETMEGIEVEYLAAIE
ncbi:MAG: hypothetical protein LIO65_05940 [Odoribacter sp.]|nr:hypothetical protein [Odoribacter sp.]